MRLRCATGFPTAARMGDNRPRLALPRARPNPQPLPFPVRERSPIVAFYVSTAKTDITPTLAQNPYMAGWGNQDNSDPRVASSSNPYSDPLLVRCVIIWEDNSPHALIGVDVLGLPRNMHQALRPRLVALANWSNSDIVISASHTHNGPALLDSLQPYTAYAISDVTLIRSYSAWLLDTIVDTVRNALNASRTAVTLDWRVTTSGIAYNRVGLSTVETQIPMLIARSGSTVRALIWSYGCHPLSASMQTLWDGDWPSGANAHIEASNGFDFALFLQGPAGDQDPTGGAWGWSLRNTHSDALGALLTTQARTAGTPVTGSLTTQYQEVNLPLDTSTSLATARSNYLSRMGNPDGQPAWYQRHAEVMVSRIDSGVTQTSIPLPLQVWRFSTGHRIALTGGELVSAYGAWARGRVTGGATKILIGGYANEVPCYIPDNQFLPGGAIPDGSYEGGWEPDHSGIAGGNLTVYPHLYHFSTSAAGTLTNALGTMIG